MRHQKNLYCWLMVLISLSLLATGCRHNINTNNPAVVAAAALGDASNTCKTLEDGLTAANAALEKLETQEPEYYAHVKPLIQRLSAVNRVAQHKIQQTSRDGVTDWRPAFISIATSITPSDLTSVGVKNPNSQIIIGSSIAGIVGILQAIGGAR